MEGFLLPYLREKSSGFIFLQLIYMGREYPKDPDLFRLRCHNSFMKNKDVKDSKEIEELIHRGEYIVKELEALYMLRKYRTLKRRYYDEDEGTKFRNIEQFIAKTTDSNVKK